MQLLLYGGNILRRYGVLQVCEPVVGEELVIATGTIAGSDEGSEFSKEAVTETPVVIVVHIHNALLLR